MDFAILADQLERLSNETDDPAETIRLMHTYTQQAAKLYRSYAENGIAGFDMAVIHESARGPVEMIAANQWDQIWVGIYDWLLEVFKPGALPENHGDPDHQVLARSERYGIELRLMTTPAPRLKVRIAHDVQALRLLGEIANEGSDWIKFVDAERITGINRGTLGRNAGPTGSGKPIIDNGAKGSDRRVRKETVIAFAQARRHDQAVRDQAKREYVAETDTKVELEFRKSGKIKD